MKQIDRLLIDRAGVNGGLLSLDDVTDLGLSDFQWLARRDIEWLPVTPFHWRHIATVPAWQATARAALSWLGPRAALFGPSGAACWELPPFGEELPVHVVVPRCRRWVGRHVVVHTTKQWSAGDLLVHRGLRTTSATRTIIDLAGQPIGARDLADVVDAAMNHRWTSVPTLRRRMDELAGPGRAGIRRLRMIILDSGGHSWLERRFLRLVRETGLPRPTCQHVYRAGGRTIARVDFHFAGSNIVVEVSGRLGHASDEERAKDARRRNELQMLGLVVLEFTTGDVLDRPDEVIATLRQALALPAAS